MLQRIKHMLIKEFLQVLRDPKMVRVIFIMPLVQVLIFGYAVTTDVRNVSLAIYDLDNSTESRELIDRFVRSGYFERVSTIYTDEEALDLLNHGAVAAVLRTNKGFSDDIRAGRTAQMQLLLDGTDSNTASVVLKYANGITNQYSQDQLAQRMRRVAGATPRTGRVDVVSRAWFNENLESRNFYLPGVIAIMVMLITFMLTSMAVVREKEIGTMEQIIVTPIRPMEFILGKTAPFAVIAIACTIMVSAIGVFWFDIPFRGSIALLALATAVFLLTTLGIGLLISTISQTQQQAMMSTFLFFFPAQLLSGFIFPIANMPTLVQYLTYIDPLRYYLVILRSLFLKGTGLDILWPQFAALAVMGVVTFGVAASRFKKTLA
jgi:ABC-2 type transport system permease protein